MTTHLRTERFRTDILANIFSKNWCTSFLAIEMKLFVFILYILSVSVFMSFNLGNFLKCNMQNVMM